VRRPAVSPAKRVKLVWVAPQRLHVWSWHEGAHVVCLHQMRYWGDVDGRARGRLQVREMDGVLRTRRMV